MLRALALVTGLMMAGWASDASAGPCAGFTDVDDASPFCANVAWMKNRGITLGCSLTLYCPTDSVNRLQMAIFVNRLADSLFPLTCTAGQVMKWNGNAWVCAADATAGGGGTVSGWGLAGNAGTNPSTQFIGTTDDQALVVRVNNVRALRIEPNPVSPNVIGGNPSNLVMTGVRGATIGGGGVAPGNSDPDYGFEDVSRISDHYGTIGGGYANWVGDAAGTLADRPFATVAGGGFNQATGAYSNVAGGGANHATNNYAAVGGGEFNEATGSHATVAGGQHNRATAAGAVVGGGGRAGADCLDPPSGMSNHWCGNLATDTRATVGGGLANVASGPESFVGGGAYNLASGGVSVVVGGYGNVASGDFSMAAGVDARANHSSSFVWNGGLLPATSQRSGEFTVSGNQVRMLAEGATCTLNGSTNGWSCTSDRGLKSGIQAVDGRDVLDRVATMPIARWSFAKVPGVTHMGPMAQDFHVAFALGDDPTQLAPMDVQGVALAAIQGLNTKVEDRLAVKDAEIATLRRELASIRALLTERRPIVCNAEQ